MMSTALYPKTSGTASLLPKAGKIMRFCVLFLLAGTLNVQAGAYSQKITVSFRQASLQTVFSFIRKQTGYVVFCDYDILQKAKPVSFSVRDASIDELVKVAIEGQDLSYSVEEKTIVITRQAQPAPAEGTEETALPPPHAVTGKVSSDSGEPLEGVSVLVTGRSQGTTTDRRGTFSLMVYDTDTLVFSHLGYVSKRIAIRTKTRLDVSLAPNTKTITDVVVVGAQTQSRRTTTASISSISGKAIENLPAPSFDQLLQGRVPGLDVQISSGEPGVSPTMVVRGNSRVSQSISGTSDLDQAHALSGPLYVIDGVPINPEDISYLQDAAGTSTGTDYLAGINVNDIESIDVQKDAAATAAWGSRGANGVIYIKTRKGRSSKPEFYVNVYAGRIQEPKLVPTVTGSTERQQKLALLQTYGNYTNWATLPQLLTDSLNPYFNNATDWQGLFYRNAAIQNADMSMSAAGENMSYRVSANYYNEQGTIKAFDFKRYSLRGNFDFKMSPKLTSQFTIAFTHSDRQRGDKLSNSDDNTPFNINNGDLPSSFFRMNAFDSSNYLGLSTNLRNQNTNDWYSASLTLNYNILPGLLFTTQGSGSVSLSNKDYFKPADQNQIQAVEGNGQASYAESDANNYTNYFLSNTLNYSKTFPAGDKHAHHIVVTGSQQFTADNSRITSVSGYNAPSNNIQVVNGIPATYLTASSNYVSSAILSFAGQVQYDYDSRYILYVADRTDGSSRFGAASKWGKFPAAGVGWVVSDEKFMSGVKSWVNLLKLRASYGLSGQNSQDYYAPYNSYTINGTYGGSTAISPSYNNGLSKSDLTWSRTYQKDIGLEFQLLNNRIYAMADIYDKTTKGDYFNFNLPFFTGYQSITFNGNDLWVDNRGLDLTLTGHIFQSAQFKWTSTLNISFNKNIIAKLPNNNRTFEIDDGYGVGRIYAVGQPIYEMFQILYKGVYSNINQIPVNPITGQLLTYYKGSTPVQPGYPIWADQNHDYDVWSGENNGDAYGDRVPSGNPNPKYTGGFINDFTYKNFSLSILSIFCGKRTIVNTFKQRQFEDVFSFPQGIYSNSVNALAATWMPNLSSVNYWNPALAAKEGPGYSASFPTPLPYGPNYYEFEPFTTMFNENGAYFKVKNITLSYLLPQSWIHRFKISRAQVYTNIDNVYTYTKSTVPDPELVNSLGIYTGGSYPVPHKFTFGLNVTF
jgi:TonB-linked SusC/RagA family outer membrane protein